MYRAIQILAQWLCCLFALAFLVICGWVYVWIRHGWNAREIPSRAEVVLARTIRWLSIPKEAKEAKNPFAPSPELLKEARRHFADHCALCHANDGSGDTPVGRNLYPKPLDLRSPEVQKETDGELYYIIHNGLRLTGMPAWGEPNEDPDSWKLVLFIRHLPQLTEEEKKEMEKWNPKNPQERAEEEEEEKFLQGQ
ncbi:c-type cytochrome [Candidatus Methylacidithermus pantelleriae]|uniref:Cytochrome c553 n=1 Tax=Candidatus Methylacidithermus pantelleriae TaxID=2744239 RepID=A0A8J2FPN4_9BACT|nr:c-type cytochrome [Candidatus Methylacidithermus pantelleriae]CAF0704221.1 Cytochrome c553 [Candidatus Methylacidithermus pantelleriae]